MSNHFPYSHHSTSRDLLAVTGQFPIAGHTLCIWKRKRIIAESKEIIAAVSCLIVVQSTSLGNGSTGRIHINAAAHACLITLHSAALGNGNSGFISINAADRLIGRPVALRHRLSPAVPFSVRFAPLSRAAQIIRLIDLL